MARALIVIDIQEEYFPDGQLPLQDAVETEGRIVAAIRRANQAADKVILVQHQSYEAAGIFAKDSQGAAIRPAILDAADSGVPIVTKYMADSFQDTTLLSHLDGIDSLLICGMMTQNCVVFTALSEMADNFHVTILSDLCAAPSAIVHQIALRALASKRSVAESADIWS